MLFISKKKSYKIILQAKRFLLSRDGEKVLQPGLKVIFQGSQFETEDKDVIKQLKSTKYFGVDYWCAEGDTAPTQEGQALESATKQASEDTLRACPHCPFNAQSKTGLMSHIRAKHPDKAVE